MIADDLFIDSQFTDAEKVEDRGGRHRGDVPFTTRDLSAPGERAPRERSDARGRCGRRRGVTVRPLATLGLAARLAPHPTLWVDAVAYVLITAIAASTRPPPADGADDWGRDEHPGARGRRLAS